MSHGTVPFFRSARRRGNDDAQDASPLPMRRGCKSGHVREGTGNTGPLPPGMSMDRQAARKDRKDSTFLKTVSGIPLEKSPLPSGHSRNTEDVPGACETTSPSGDRT